MNEATDTEHTYAPRTRSMRFQKPLQYFTHAITAQTRTQKKTAALAMLS